MITSVKEVYRSNQPDPAGDEYTFWTYMICKCVSDGKRRRYHLIRIDSCAERMERLGCELPLGFCRRLIRKYQPNIKTKTGS